MGPVLLQEEIGLPGENLRYLLETNWRTLFQHMTKATLIRWLHEAEIWTRVTVVRDTCITTVSPAPQAFVFEKRHLNLWRRSNSQPLKIINFILAVSILSRLIRISLATTIWSRPYVVPQIPLLISITTPNLPCPIKRKMENSVIADIAQFQEMLTLKSPRRAEDWRKKNKEIFGESET